MGLVQTLLSPFHSKTAEADHDLEHAEAQGTEYAGEATADATSQFEGEQAQLEGDAAQLKDEGADLSGAPHDDPAQ